MRLTPGALLKALRPTHWTKNLLVFAGLLLGGRIGSAAAWQDAGLAFLALCASASAGYLVNDLRDIDADRAHPTKRLRPLAAGTMKPRTALGSAGLLAVAALFPAAAAGGEVLLLVLLYLVLTLAYSLGARRLRYLDVGLLAGLFVLRVLAGTAAVQVAPSWWLIAFCVALFLSLALAKRADELAADGAPIKLAGRAYGSGDGDRIRVLGLLAGGAAIALLATYVADAAYPAYYRDARWLWGFPLCVGVIVARIWQMAWRGRLEGDPVMAAWRDPATLAAGAALGACFARAIGWL